MFRLDDLIDRKVLTRVADSNRTFFQQHKLRKTKMALPILDPNAPEFTRRYVNLADPRLGAQALEASDDFFARRNAC